MPRPRVYKTEAVVLRYDPLGDADKILTLYTPQLGKLRAVAKGVRRPRSKLAGHVEPITRSAMLIAQGRNLDIVSQSQTIDGFLSLKEDLTLTTQAMYIAELLGLFTAEGDADLNLYQGLLTALNALPLASDSGLILRHYELHLLNDIGYKPQLENCISCHSPIDATRLFFSASGGGIVCSGCSHGVPSTQPISGDTLKTLRVLQKTNVQSILEKVPPPGLSTELERTNRDYMCYLLDRAIKSTVFLDTVSKGATSLAPHSAAGRDDLESNNKPWGCSE